MNKDNLVKEKLVDVKIFNSIKYKGRWIEPAKKGQPVKIVELEEDIALYLVGHKKAEYCNPKDAKSDIPDLSKSSDTAIDVLLENDTIISVLCTIDGVTTNNAQLLISKGYKTIQAIADLELSDLTAIKGIGLQTATIIQNSAVDLVD